MRLLGLDPGLRITGWGIVDVSGSNLRHVAHGIIKSTSTLSLAKRLVELHKGIADVVEDFAPLEAAVEETFVNDNPASALKLGIARGIVLSVPALLGLEVFEYSANKVKKAVVGAGHADKNQVALMVQRLLPTAGDVKLDSADALAVAICHASHRQTRHYVDVNQVSFGKAR